MEVWTDGTTHVVAGEKSGVVVLDGTRKRLENQAISQSWKTVLAVDVDHDRLWTGTPAACYRLSDLTVIEEIPGLDCAASIGDGKIAGIFGNGPNEPAELKIGAPGAWDFVAVLGPYETGRVGVSQASEVPDVRFVGRDPHITANEFGIVVTDGPAGLVLKFDHSGQMETPWLSGGVNETELFGFATEHGVVVTARWAARHSSMYHLEDQSIVEIGSGFGSKAVATESHVFLFGGEFGGGLQVLDRQFAEIASHQEASGSVQAVAASANVGIAAGVGFAHIFTAASDGITHETVKTIRLYELIVVFAVPDVEVIESVCEKHGMNSWTGQGSDSSFKVVVTELDKETADSLADSLRTEELVTVTRVRSLSRRS